MYDNLSLNAHLVVAAAFGLLAWPECGLTPHTAGDVLAALAVDTIRAAGGGLGSWLRLHDGVSTCKWPKGRDKHLLSKLSQQTPT
jgi:hypothetical protein